jgi:transposase
MERAKQGWVVGFQDEVWWSRVTQPRMHAWAGVGQPLRLQEFEPDKKGQDRKDPDPKALCCYGLLREDTHQMLLRFVEGRAVSHVTTAYLEWVSQVMVEEGKSVLVLIWDNASWHISREVMSWIREHNRQVLADRREGGGKAGVQLVPCFLPSKSPWLNSIEPKWVAGKRAVVEPSAKLPTQHLAQRVCSYYGCDHLEHLKQNVS